jgi:pantothenate synthetase
LTRIDYVELRDAEELSTIEGNMSRKAVLAMAVFVGSENKKTRLIDNRVIG